MPARAKQICVGEENWPENFNFDTDSVTAYAIMGENGLQDVKYFLYKPNCDWIEYYPALEPESAPEPKYKGKKLRGTGQKFLAQHQLRPDPPGNKDHRLHQCPLGLNT
ncbi:hypothetical protein ONS96_000293 [Cadophora gregata f. sp. sojae]|nr:hypothetical protein ONS96_000293 [Cadophora gregata f. sp. sojae]